MTIHSRKITGLDLTALRARLAGESGPRYWRSLEELAGTGEFEDFLQREFPSQLASWSDATTRRSFLGVMGASLALAGVSGCSTEEPTEKIVPYVLQPENLVPGKPMKYATAIEFGGFGVGVLAESHEGRPTMVEGNAAHPDSLGALDPMIQATMLTLYDPDRSQVALRESEINTWDNFLTEAVAALDALRPAKGEGVRVLTKTVTSPSLARQLRLLMEELPAARWHQNEPISRDTARAGATLAFGSDVAVRHHFEKADIVLALDADFLSRGPAHLRDARAFAARREPPNMNRLYVVEATPTITGAMADHRLPLKPSEVAGVAAALAARLGVKIGGTAPPTTAPARWIEAVARDLQAHQGKSLVVVGDAQPPFVHALGHALNRALGNVGQTIEYTEPVEARPVDEAGSLKELVNDMQAGKVSWLLIVDANPAYTATADVPFAEALKKVAFSARLGLYEDETSVLCTWHLPRTHDLEAWGDLRASDGTATIQQPLIAPLYKGRSPLEVLAGIRRHPTRTGHELVRETWREREKGRSDDDFETFWETSVHDGVVARTALAVKEVTLLGDLAAPPAPPAPASPSGKLELIFAPDPTIWDGRFANNGWLQELPKPLTKLTWENAALVSPATAARLTLANGDMVDLIVRHRVVRAPVWIQPGHADDAVTVALGYGRTHAGRVGSRIGFNAYALRTADAPWFAPGLEVRKTTLTTRLASTETHRNVASEAEQERGLVRVFTLADFLQPDFAHRLHHDDETPGPEETLYPRIEGSVSRLDDPALATARDDLDAHYAWGMVINLNTCIGCNACVTGCQSENNIPVVGKEEILRGREMQWIDIDRYYHGTSLENPATYHQPRLCMHCENAPCELVCPVEATVHDSEGLNNMVYNRCVGTRYCGNNCPYKVRHFNFFQYADLRTPSLTLLNNPDVTVRARGVMEKCTYCVQRINGARYEAEKAGRRIADGEIVTACQAACPTRAITFGDVNDKTSAVSRRKADPRNYGMLAELNTRPRTSYTAKLRNPNPELEGGAA